MPGGAFSNKNCPQGRLNNFFKSPGYARMGMLAAGIDSHIRLRLFQKVLKNLRKILDVSPKIWDFFCHFRR